MTQTSSMITKGTAVLNPGTHDQTWGLLKDFTDVTEADKEQVKNGDGNTVGLIFSDARRKITATYTPLAAAGTTDPPKMDEGSLIGSPLSFTGGSGATSITIIIEGAERSGSQGKAPSFKIEGYYYPNLPTGGTL